MQHVFFLIIIFVSPVSAFPQIILFPSISHFLFLSSFCLLVEQEAAGVAAQGLGGCAVAELLLMQCFSTGRELEAGSRWELDREDQSPLGLPHMSTQHLCV